MSTLLLSLSLFLSEHFVCIFILLNFSTLQSSFIVFVSYFCLVNFFCFLLSPLPLTLSIGQRHPRKWYEDKIQHKRYCNIYEITTNSTLLTILTNIYLNCKGGSKNGLGAGTFLPISMNRGYAHFKVWHVFILWKVSIKLIHRNVENSYSSQTVI